MAYEQTTKHTIPWGGTRTVPLIPDLSQDHEEFVCKGGFAVGRVVLVEGNQERGRGVQIEAEGPQMAPPDLAESGFPS